MKLALVFAVFAASITSAQAATTDIITTNGEFGQVTYTYNNGGWANGTVSVDGAGVNRTAYLFYVAYNPTNGYRYWSGNIPVDAVTVNGVAQISVNIDTCTVNATPACGPVNFQVSTNEPASGWINNGVWGYQYDGYSVKNVGAAQARSSSATGTILDQVIDNGRSWIGTMDNVTIELTVGN